MLRSNKVTQNDYAAVYSAYSVQFSTAQGSLTGTMCTLVL